MKFFGKIVASVLFLVSLYLLAFKTKQSDFVLIVSLYIAGFASFTYILFQNYTSSILKLGIGLGIAGRLVLLFGFPFHSDDIYRFYWDASLILEGYSPFTFLPSEALSLDVPGLNQELYNSLNSQEYYSVYPVVCQTLFTTARWLSGESLALFSIFIKSFFLLAELVSLFFGLKLLKHLGKKSHLILLYFLNPLIIVELCGNLHFESIMLSFVAPGLFFLMKNRFIKAGLFFALAIAAKIVPALLVVIIFRKLKLKNYIKFALSTGALTILLFIPVFYGHVSQFASSLDLYFRSFEFNASIYYLARQFAYLFYEWNMIAVVGPTLAILTISAVAITLVQTKRLSWEVFFNTTLLLWCFYLGMSTTVHPWYLAMPIFLSIFTPYRFVIVWSALIVLSYSHYSGGNYSENYYLIAFEYLVVLAYFVHELKKKRNTN